MFYVIHVFSYHGFCMFGPAPSGIPFTFVFVLLYLYGYIYIPVSLPMTILSLSYLLLLRSLTDELLLITIMAHLSEHARITDLMFCHGHG